MAGFAQSLRATWRPFLLRFAGALGLLAPLWLALGPIYARMLLAVTRPLIPVLNETREILYLVEGSTIVTTHRIPMPVEQGVVTIRRVLWVAASDCSAVLLTAAILASLGWTWRQRGRALVWSLGLLFLTQVVFLIASSGDMQLWPITTNNGPPRPPDYSAAKVLLFHWFYAFFEIMGRGFFVLLFYLGALAFTWGRIGTPIPARAVGRNDPCRCGSRLKAKRCCGV